MPKPSVTKLVQSLETHLRVKLLNRTTRQVTVTPDGGQSKVYGASDPTLTSPRGHALRHLLYLFERDEAVRLIRAG